VRHAFQPLPGARGRARPVVDLVVEGLEVAPQAFLIDTGATGVRIGRHVAELTGVEPDKTAQETIVVGGMRTTGWPATVELELRAGRDSHVWTATAFFCDPWPWAFALLGLTGLDPFILTIDTYEEWSQLQPRGTQ
jgi:hypothetical protein